jgi:hypothetical protein
VRLRSAAEGCRDAKAGGYGAERRHASERYQRKPASSLAGLLSEERQTMMIGALARTVRPVNICIANLLRKKKLT